MKHPVIKHETYEPNKNAVSKAASVSPPSSGISFVDQPVQRKENNTGLPDQLKSGVESLSGIDISDVKVHYNSSQPAQLNAHAYAQGNQIHIAPGQEKHLPHEAWHVVQQKQGRVKPTMQLKGKVNINDDVGLEKEADVMGGKAMQLVSVDSNNEINHSGITTKKITDSLVQRSESNTSFGVPVIQRTKFEEKSNPNGKRAAPFQLAAVQFTGEYDIKQFENEIAEYASACQAAGTVPVIELRMYDAAIPKSVDNYMAGARVLLNQIIKGPFAVTCSILRDETLPPAQLLKEEDAPVMSVMERFVEGIQQMKDLTVRGDMKGLPRGPAAKEMIDNPLAKMLAGKMMIPLPEALEYMHAPNSELEAICAGGGAAHYSLHEKLFARVILMNRGQHAPSGAAAQQQQAMSAAAASNTSLAKTEAHLPPTAASPAALAFGSAAAASSTKAKVTGSGSSLAAIEEQTAIASQDASAYGAAAAASSTKSKAVPDQALVEAEMNHKAEAASSVAGSAAAAASAAAAHGSAPPLRLRRNSLVTPHTLTLTNLVTGSEEATAENTLRACRAAFEKGATQVLLIVEVEGPKNYPRAETQVTLLRKEGFTVEVVGRIESAVGVQQSGVMLSEGKPQPRVKLRVTDKPSAESAAASAADAGLVKSSGGGSGAAAAAASSAASYSSATGGGSAAASESFSGSSSGLGGKQHATAAAASAASVRNAPLSFYQWMEFRGYWGDYDSAMEDIMYKEYQEYNPKAPDRH